MSTVMTPAIARPPTQVEKTVVLKDGRDLIIRTMRPADLSASLAFFRALSADDRRYLRVDVTQPELVERRIEEMSADRVERLVAIDWNLIVADGSLELRGHGWGDGVGEIRLIVSSSMQRRGLGSLMALELYHLAVQHRLDRIVARAMAPQVGARRVFARLGFEEEFVIPKHVRDQEGRWQDLVIMRCDIEEMWKRMQDVFERSCRVWHH